MQVNSLDHLVLTVRDIATTCTFYTRVLGMEQISFGPDNRKALTFGSHKINLHETGKELEPKAENPVAGSADLCLLTQDTMEQITTHLKNQEIPVILGPVQRTGATGSIVSVYIRDPDGNLLELATRHPDQNQ